MRIVLTSFGSTGDVHSFIALGVELDRSGHQVIIAFPPYLERLVKPLGLEFIPVGPDLGRPFKDFLRDAVEGKGDALNGSVNRLLSYGNQFAKALPQVFHELGDLCRSADVLIGGRLQPAARMIHELTGIPFASIQTTFLANRESLAYRDAVASLVNPFRTQLRLPPLLYPLTCDAHSPQLAIYAMSRHICPPLSNLPAHHHMTGFFFLDDDAWRPDPALIEFIEDGDPPVVFTFGSMPHEDPKTITNLILDVVSRVNCRAVIQQGWSELKPEGPASNIHLVGHLPHAWLFPRAKCVVHHGGAGTTGAVFRAGVPHIFIPHSWDQPDWARFAQKLGCAEPMIPYQQLTAENLASTLRRTLSNSSYFKSASMMGERVRTERGAYKARRLIETMVTNVSLYSGD